jgi:hypothetical protein
MDPRTVRSLVLLSVIAALITLALYGAHRTFRVAAQRQCVTDGGRWDPAGDACVGARPPLAAPSR